VRVVDGLADLPEKRADLGAKVEDAHVELGCVQEVAGVLPGRAGRDAAASPMLSAAWRTRSKSARTVSSMVKLLSVPKTNFSCAPACPKAAARPRAPEARGNILNHLYS
jgi:hypothetical protein